MAVLFPVKPVTVGPLVGHTTHSTVRLWGRGGRPAAPGGQLCYGVAQLLEPGATVPSHGAYFKLRPEDDFTGTVDFQGLEPGKPYAYRMGYFFSDVDQHLMLPALGLELQGAVSGVLRTARPPGGAEFSLVFGSCRHPMPALEDVFQPNVPERADRIFRTILEQVEGGTATDLFPRPDFRAYSIISSAFHPPPITPPDFLFESPGILDGQSDYVVTRNGGYTASSNFTRLTWKEPTLRVAVYERKGKLLHDTSLNLDG